MSYIYAYPFATKWTLHVSVIPSSICLTGKTHLGLAIFLSINRTIISEVLFSQKYSFLQS